MNSCVMGTGLCTSKVTPYGLKSLFRCVTPLSGYPLWNIKDRPHKRGLYVPQGESFGLPRPVTVVSVIFPVGQSVNRCLTERGEKGSDPKIAFILRPQILSRHMMDNPCCIKSSIDTPNQKGFLLS